MSQTKPKGPALPGFTPLSDQVFVREGDSEPETSGPEAEKEAADHQTSPHPHTVVIYGWGDGLPKHVVKYSDGYRQLYPRAKQILVLGPIYKAMFSGLDARSESMLPVAKSLGSDVDGKGKGRGDTAPVLIHAMSNTGAVNYAATLHAYRQFYGRPLPHALLVLDSTPGSPEMSWATLRRWSRAMTLGTAAWFPWPFAVTQGMWGAFLCVNGALLWASGQEAAGVFALRACDDESYEIRDAKRLYLYSKEDDLISHEDIESYAAAAKEKGYDLRAEIFDGSGHVGHMRSHPEKYWKAIGDAWAWSR